MRAERVASCSAGGTAVTVTFGPDGHQAAFGWPWLEAHALDEPAPPDARTEDAKALWDGGPAALPSADWADYQAGDAVRAGILAAVVRHGAAVLRGVPAEPGMVARVAATLGYVRETNYGRLFDVRAEPSPRNLAYTTRLAPGDCLIIDNTRGGRHLQGCYADLDGLASTLSVLRRGLAS